MTHPITRILRRLAPLLIAALVMAPGTNHAVDLEELGAGPASQAGDEDKPDIQQLHSSLDNIIATLDDDEKRAKLSSQLKDLRDTLEAREDEESTIPGARGGLLGALSNSLASFTDNDKNEGTSLDIWRHYTQSAFKDLQALIANARTIDLIGYSAAVGTGLVIWAGLLFLISHGGHRLFRRWHWPLKLPPEPRPWMILVHFLRRTLPYLALFAVLLTGVRLLQMRSPVTTSLLVTTYITLCGRLLSTVFDIVISLFAHGHKRVAVSILHDKALRPLFFIGALIALGDAINTPDLSHLLGTNLADWLSIMANALAGLVCAVLVLIVRRPVVHLIRNRSLKNRLKKGGLRYLISVLAQLWHVPVLLLIVASLAATLLTGGQANAPFTRAMVCAVLLVATFVITGLIRRQYERVTQRRARNLYTQRLRSLGHVLAHAVIWLTFLEASARVWGVSLFGLGARGQAGGEVGRALIRLGLTVIIAWLVWIVGDTAIQRGMRGVRSDGRRRHQSRAQTVTPMMRNLALFFILIVSGIIGLANLGVNVTPLLAGAGVIGIAVGFGAQSLVADLITGIFILIEDSLAVGDFVEINGFWGTVEGLNLRVVRLRDLDAVVHITTFSHIQTIHNMSREYGIALMKLRIPHDLPIDDAIELMRRTASDLNKDPFMRGLIRSHLEMQGIHEFDNGCPILRMRMRTTPEYQWDVGRAFNLALKRRMESEQITIGSPRMSIAMEAGGGTRFDKRDKPSEPEKASTIDWPTDDSPSPDPG